MNASFLRTAHVPRAALRTAVYRPTSAMSQRFAHSSYGGDEESGIAKSDKPNRAVDQEHPGPPPPDTSSSKSTSSSSSKKSTSTSDSQGSAEKQGSQNSGGSGGSKKTEGRPAIYKPEGPSEQESEDVKKHNEEMSQRYEKTGNQIGEDHKVDKGFWKSTLLLLSLELNRLHRYRPSLTIYFYGSSANTYFI